MSINSSGFLSKEETYELVRNVIEADLNPGEISNIRWHFRYNMDDNVQLYLSIALSIVELAKPEIVQQFTLIEKHGFRRIRLVQDMVDKFLLDYINFIGIIKFLPFFLYEGVKGLYRYIYGIIALCHFKIEKKEEEKKEAEAPKNEMTTLSDKITSKTEIVKLSQEEVAKLYKAVTNKLENWSYFMDTITVWDLTHKNNNFSAIKIPSELIEDDNNNYDEEIMKGRINKYVKTMESEPLLKQGEIITMRRKFENGISNLLMLIWN